MNSMTKYPYLYVPYPTLPYPNLSSTQIISCLTPHLPSTTPLFTTSPPSPLFTASPPLPL